MTRETVCNPDEMDQEEFENCPKGTIDFLIEEIYTYGLCSAPEVESDNFQIEFCSGLEYS